MYRYLILIIIVVMCSERCSYAQNNMNMIEILNVEQDIINLENRIKNVIKKNVVRIYIFLLLKKEANNQE